ncbi:MAG: phage portal protein [Desulfobaccales bacterium]
MAIEPKSTPLTPEIISAAQWAAGRRFTPTGTGSAPGQPDPSQDFFGPGLPLPAIAPPSAAGRQFDYPVGHNLLVTPRGDLPISFLDLRNLAQNCDLVRLVIETRKDQIAKMDWSVSPRDPSGNKLKASQDTSPEAQRQVKEATALLRRPDGMHSFNAWMRMLLEDMLVIDAATLYPRRTRGGALYALEVVDGATIRPVIDEWGRTPLPPDPAYQQIIKGLPATDYTREELLYYPRNLLSWRLYGFSPVEQIIIIINVILRRQMHLLQYYTDGNLPDALLEVPENWSTSQIAEFQSYWDALHTGNTAQRRRGKWVPHGTTPHLMKEGDLKSPIDEWFARVVCYAFSVSPQPFVQTINRATAETAQEAALSEGLAPLMEWMADFINYALQGFGFDQVEFAWMQDSAMDPQVQAQIDDLDVRNGIRLRSEIRAARGLQDDGAPDFIMTIQGAVLVSEIGKEPELEAAATPPEGETLPEEEAPPDDEAAAEGKGQK